MSASTSPQPLEVFLGFNFYGAGNIGDDLMVAGFLEGLLKPDRYAFKCCLAQDRLASQKRRFPSIHWQSAATEERNAEIQRAHLWLGIGGTPFQAAGGKWLLKSILRDYEANPDVPKWMFGIGCEAEVVQERELAQAVVRQTQRIWTRDEASRSVLVDELGADPKNVLVAGDLAHLALKRVFADGSERRGTAGRAGLVVYGDRTAPLDMTAIRRFANSLSGEHEVVFLANDVRSTGAMEKRLYQRTFGGIRGMFRWKPGWYAPEYHTADIPGLVEHFTSFETVMSSRYHALVAAAWAGCRVVAISRSSKIAFLADELGIPLVSKDFDEHALRDGFTKAQPVDRSELLACERAGRGALGDLESAMEGLVRI
jgi:polysaccharide pyruvyl transferase WcaK-like protein